MPKANDLESKQAMGGRPGGQKGMPRPAPDLRKKDTEAKQPRKDDEPRLE